MLFPFPIKKQCPLVTEGHSWKDAGVLPAANLALLGGAERAGWSLPCQQGQHSVHKGAEAGRAAEQSTLEGLEGCLSDVYGAAFGLSVFYINVQEERREVNAFLLLSQKRMFLQHQISLLSMSIKAKLWKHWLCSQPAHFLARKLPRML